VGRAVLSRGQRESHQGYDCINQRRRNQPYICINIQTGRRGRKTIWCDSSESNNCSLQMEIIKKPNKTKWEVRGRNEEGNNIIWAFQHLKIDIL